MRGPTRTLVATAPRLGEQIAHEALGARRATRASTAAPLGLPAVGEALAAGEAALVVDGEGLAAAGAAVGGAAVRRTARRGRRTRRGRAASAAMGMAERARGRLRERGAAARAAREIEAADAEDAAVERRRSGRRARRAAASISKQRIDADAAIDGADEGAGDAERLAGHGAEGEARPRRGAGDRGASRSGGRPSGSVGRTSARSRVTSAQMTRPADAAAALELEDDLDLVADGLVAREDRGRCRGRPSRCRPRRRRARRRSSGARARRRRRCASARGGGRAHPPAILWSAVIIRSIAAGLAPSRCAWPTMSRRRWLGLRGELGADEELGERAEREEVAERRDRSARARSRRGSGRRAPWPAGRW